VPSEHSFISEINQSSGGYQVDRVISFWHLKPRVDHILSSNARECPCIVGFYKPCTLAASESKFDHTNRILRLKSKRAGLYSIRVNKMSGLAIDRLLLLWSLHGLL